MREEPKLLTVIQDRLRLGSSADRSRLVEALEAALRAGHGRVSVHALDAEAASAPCCASPAICTAPIAICTTRMPRRDVFVQFAARRLRYLPRFRPRHRHRLRPGRAGQRQVAGRRAPCGPWQTPSYKECQDDLLRYARKRGIPVDVPWRELSDAQRHWVIEGEGPWSKKVWYGARRFFDWLESRAYKMHIRVLLSKYRSYTLCASLPRCAPEARCAAVAPRAQAPWQLDASLAPPGLAIDE